MSMNRTAALLTFAAVFAIATPAARAQTLVNGNFADWVNGVPTGWTMLHTEAARTAGNEYLFNHTWDRWGYFNAVAGSSQKTGIAIECEIGDCSLHEGFAQTLTGLNVGDSYAITFQTNAMHYNPATGGFSNQPVGWAVTFGDSTQLGKLAATTEQSAQYQNTTYKPWVASTLTFVATAATQTLTFTSQIAPRGAPDWSVLALSGVSINDVTPAVPEPSEAALLLGGLGALVFLSRRRTAKK